jgi:CBS domain-containing protein
VEGERATPPTAGRLMRDDVVRAAPDDRVLAVREAIAHSAYPFALVTGQDGMLLGRVRTSELDGATDRPVGELMELGPSTVRPHRAAGELAKRLADDDLHWAIVTTPEGKLLGVVSRRALEQAG